MDLSDSKELQALDELIEQTTGDSVIAYFLPPYLVDLDPQGSQVGKSVVKKIQESDSYDRIYRFARIAGSYPTESIGWDTISLAVCATALALTLPSEEKDSLYLAIDANRIHSYSSAIGEVPSLFYDQVKNAEMGLQSESHPERKEYWQKKLEWAKAELSREEEKAKEDRGE